MKTHPIMQKLGIQITMAYCHELVKEIHHHILAGKNVLACQQQKKRIFSELVNLCFNVVFTDLSQLFVQVCRNLVGAEIFNSLK